MPMTFLVSLHGLFSLKAVCISWLMQDMVLSSHICVCQCLGAALLLGSVCVTFLELVPMLNTKFSFIKHCLCFG
jgi:hypothetical protein